MGSESLGVIWSADHQILVRSGDLRHEFNVSWSEDPVDTVSTLVYYKATADNSFAHSFGAQVCVWKTAALPMYRVTDYRHLMEQIVSFGLRNALH